ncbi:hypothetical protein HUT18_21260 [Streptomyces sp. NA04227]|uniref:hypothetical protein n=1 Tax=Streptomyces sp. NA04227 TaxID=2742136 RepID=UPI00158FCF4A|nr:hypothetical protein [Streptomyces sp. NA04227]QKW08517.1 hypothetical protein HUT18_21260 [Streptomyces sp. NA04227]
MLESKEFLHLPLTRLESLVSEIRATAAPQQAWEALRDFSVGKMQTQEIGVIERVRWGKLALETISKKREAEYIDTAKQVAESARVRSYLIKEFGPADDDATRSPEDLSRYVIDNIETDCATASEMSAHWRELEPSQMLPLRRIKNMLTPLQDIHPYLASHSKLNNELKEWLELIPKLP